MRLTLLGLAVGLTVATLGMKPALADTFTVSDIEVEGLQRVSAGTVFGSFPINIGEEVDGAELAEAIKSLFRTGLFTDIQASRDAGALILTVRERPSISSIEIDGNKNIETDILIDALSGAGLEEGQVFRRATLERLELEILRSYIGQGRYNARVKATANELPSNRVDISLDINEGSVAAIHHINLVGNQEFSDDELKDLLELQSTGWWNSITNSDKYARERLSGDLETLRSFYLDRGYLDFSVESSQVSISPDKQKVFIVIALNEGRQYTLSDIRLRGNLIVPEQELLDLIPVKVGDVFSRAQMTAISDSLSFRL
ncbi:MAG TPA: outer membrane protein assembly factor BamA, partial [Marinobacter sp.]|nr:outer membrane protein assembly factor BamA [Marinobacter sp.]